MKNLSCVLTPAAVVPSSNTTETTVSLHQLVNQLMNSFIPLAVEKRSFIINDVDPAISLSADQQVLAYVVGNLLSNAISSTKSVCIRIEAVKKDGAVQICVRNNAASFYHTATDGYSQLLEATSLLGGHIHICNQMNQGMVTTLSLAA